MNYGFVGFGHLAQAIHQSLKDDKKITFGFVSKGHPHKEVKNYGNLEALVSFADVLWLCVKPQNLAEVLEPLRGMDLKGKQIVSPVAGKSIGFIEGYLGKETAIVRIMPNLAIAFQESVTAFTANHPLSEFSKRVKADLKKLGKVVELPEKHFDLFTALFGSGPAFLLEILAVLKKKTEELGVSGTEANELMSQLVTGTMTYFESNSKKGIPELINQIASKGGTTEAGLKSFRENKLDHLLEGVVESARKRSQEIGG